MLAVSTAEEQGQWERFEATLGLRWDLHTLVGAADETQKKKDEKPKPVQLSNVVRVPLLVAMAPDFFKHLSEDMAKKYRSLKKVEHESGGGEVIDIGTLSPRAAKELFMNAAAQMAVAPPVKDDG